jgi:hypothetical protein
MENNLDWCGKEHVLSYKWFHSRMLRLTWLHCVIEQNRIPLTRLTAFLNMEINKTRSSIAIRIIEGDKKYVSILCHKKRICK